MGARGPAVTPAWPLRGGRRRTRTFFCAIPTSSSNGRWSARSSTTSRGDPPAHLAAAAYELPLTPRTRRVGAVGRARQTSGQAGPAARARGPLSAARPGYPRRRSRCDPPTEFGGERGERAGRADRHGSTAARTRWCIRRGLPAHGRQHEVEDLDLAPDARVVRPFEGDWYTQPKTESETGSSRARATRRLRGHPLARDRVVTEQVVHYQKKRVADHSVLDLLASRCPRAVRDPSALVRVPDECCRRSSRSTSSRARCTRRARADRRASADSDVRPLGHRRLSTAFHRQTARATIFIYDGHQAGWGSRVWATSASRRWWTTPCG